MEVCNWEVLAEVKTIKLTILFVFSALLIQAQIEHTAYGFRTLPQVVKLNPGMMPASKVNTTMLPALSSIGVGANNSGFTFNRLLAEDGTGIDDVVNNLGTSNFIDQQTDIELLHFGFRLKENYFHFNLTEKIRFGMIYPGDMMRLLWEGNGKSLLGQRANMDDLSINFNWYREYMLGYTRNVGKTTSIGFNVKYLNGMLNMRTKESRLGLFTDSLGFDLSLDGAFELNTSGIPDTNSEFNPSQFITNGNGGFGLDLGFWHEGKKGLNFSLSILNIGRIVWKENVRTFDNTDINFDFRGIDIVDVFNTDDSTSTSSLELLQDSLQSIFSVGQNTNSYSTGLPMQVFGSISQSFFDKVEVMLVGNMRYQDGYLRTGARLGATVTLGNILGVTANYGVYGNSFVNVGFGFSVAGGPVQLHVISDNVLAFIDPFGAKNAHVRLGFNLTFGKHYKRTALRVRA